LSPLTFGVAGSIVALLLRAKRRREASDSILASAALASLADPGLKAPFRRRRPPEMWLAKGSDSSFPSGHSMSACAVPTIVAYVLARERLISPATGVALATIPALGVGVTRLYLRKHWATDVLAGWAAGLALPGVWIHAGAAPGALMLAGGLLYTAGAISYHRRRPDPYPSVFGYHEVFHAYVCAGATCQYVAIALLIS